MKKFFLLVISMILLIFITACGESNDDNASANVDQEESKTIKAGIGINEEHPQYKALAFFKEIVEEETDITVEIYPSGQLGDDKQMIQAVQLGTQELTIPSTAPLSNFIPDFTILSFPFLFPNTEVVDEVLDGPTGQSLLDKLEEHDLIGLNYWEEGFYNISNNIRPIENADDLKGIKIRTMENEILLDIFQELGANPTPMAFGEVYTALQQGVVDAQTNPLDQIYEAKFHEVQDYVSATNDYYGASVFLMNKDFFEGLTDEEQEVVKRASIEARDLDRKLSRESVEEYLNKIVESGVDYNELTSEGRASIEEKIQPVIDKYSKDFQETADDFFNAIEEAQSE